MFPRPVLRERGDRKAMSEGGSAKMHALGQDWVRRQGMPPHPARPDWRKRRLRASAPRGRRKEIQIRASGPYLVLAKLAMTPQGWGVGISN
jgi:hypothetical protein